MKESKEQDGMPSRTRQADWGFGRWQIGSPVNIKKRIGVKEISYWQPQMDRNAETTHCKTKCILNDFKAVTAEAARSSSRQILGRSFDMRGCIRFLPIPPEYSPKNEAHANSQSKAR